MSEKLVGSSKVGLVQINNSFSGQNYLPYSVGILQSYAQKYLQFPEDFEFMIPLYKRLPVDEAVQQLESASIVFFSMYVWNSQISLEIAKSLKDRNPNVIIVFGGPHVPDRVQDFLTKNTFIDMACHNEGEQAFLSILEFYLSGKWEKIPSISYRLKNGTIRQNERFQRLKDLSVIPSPYLSGVFDPLMKANPNEQWLMMWETNRGCPFSCTFCDWGSAVQSKVIQFEMDRLYKELEWCAKNRIEFIFCADANFGIMPRDLDIVNYAAKMKKEYGYPHALSVQNTKNATERAYQVQKSLTESGLNKGVTIAFQSLDPTTLSNIKRDNISTESFRELQRRFTRDGIETYSDMILGLPGESYDTFTDGVSSTIENGQHNRIQFGNLSLLPNAEMGDPDYQKKYGLQTVNIREVIYHGIISDAKGEISESSQTVIATDTMPKEDWVKTRAFCWMTALLHFDKLLQIPLVITHQETKVSYRKLIEIFSLSAHKKYPILHEIQSFFIQKAKEIQNGGVEYCPSPENLNIWWPADEFIFIKLVREDKLDQFYKEARNALFDYLNENSIDLHGVALSDAIELNRNLIKLPFVTDDINLNLSYNIMEYYKAVLIGQEEHLVHGENKYQINRSSKSWATWDLWLREVVWYGNKKGAYLYGHSTLLPELEGHF